MFVLWFLATRPKTLVASVIPVFLGSCLSFQQTGKFNYLLIFLCLLFALLIQIATNFYNDYYDNLSGADSKRKLGPTRLVEVGLINGKTLRNCALVILLTSFLLGIFIMEYSGASHLLLLVGIGSVICAFAYTGGPIPFAYNGLGDLFVILFFGFVAVCSTHYVLVIKSNLIWIPNWLVPLGVGLQINNLLVVNNYRDYDTDKESRKNTLVVLLGRKIGLGQYFIGFTFPFLITPMIDKELSNLFILWPIGLVLNYKLFQSQRKNEYSILLASTSMLIIVYGIILGWAVVNS